MLQTELTAGSAASENLRRFGDALSHTYGELPPQFFAHVDPAPAAAPRLIAFNSVLARELGLDAALSPVELAAVFSGSVVAPGSFPLAMAYAGHQFGQFVPQLGDGRALLLGEVRDRQGVRRDLQLKGAGRTPFSRGGDGRAALGPVLREYLVSEAMYALGIPATRALAAVATGEPVYRDRAVPGAVLTRVALSHVRVGTFQFFAARGDTDAVKRLADYVIERLYPEVAGSANPYLELLHAVIKRQARLVSAWMHVGFIHGVMNTDNMAISGETIDFGPCAFLDAYEPLKVFSSIDQKGRYAYGNQPIAAQWNLARFAETLLGLLDADGARAIQFATAAVGEFSSEFDLAWLDGVRRKLGLFCAEEGDGALAREWLELLHRNRADFTLTFRRLCNAAESADADGAVAELFADPTAYDHWAQGWRARLAREPQLPGDHAASMRRVNPAVIPRNHRIEHVIEAAVERDDFAPFEALAQALSRPYEEAPSLLAFASPPLPEERVAHTFCGT